MKLMTILLFTLSFNVFANGLNDLSVEVDQSAETVLVKVKTSTRSSMCHLGVTSLHFSKSVDNEEASGRVEVTFARDRMSVCMTAFGPHKGRLVLTKGSEFPKLAKGEAYELVVNGEVYPSLLKVD